MENKDRYSATTYSYEEMIRLVLGKNAWQTNDLDGRIDTLYVSDGPVGIRSDFDYDLSKKETELPSTSYPSGEVLAQTFDVELAKEYAKSIADDLIERNLDVLLAPGINIKRNPLCGRNFEYFSEDPYLSGEMAKGYIEGLNEKHVGSSLKHYVCNNSEYQRQWVSSEVDERTLQEIYLRNFDIAFSAHPWTLMCSYNLVNGVRMSENRPLYEHAHRHGFDGRQIGHLAQYGSELRRIVFIGHHTQYKGIVVCIVRIPKEGLSVRSAAQVPRERPFCNTSLPGARSPKPKARSPRPKARSPERKARRPKPGTWGLGFAGRRDGARPVASCRRLGWGRRLCLAARCPANLTKPFGYAGES